MGKRDRSRKGSFALRILLVPVFLLVIPLFIESFFLFQEEYRMQIKDIRGDLALLAEERARFIEEMIHLDWAFLDALDGSSPFRLGPIKRIEKPKGVEPFFLLANRSKNKLLVGKVETPDTALVIGIPFSLIGASIPKKYPVHLALFASSKPIWEQSEKLPSVIEVKRPILGTDLVIVLSVSQKALRKMHLQNYYLRFFTLLFFVGFIGGLCVYFFMKRVSRPLKRLQIAMDKVSQGHLSARYEPDWIGFEINELGQRFNHTLEKLLHYQEEVQKEKLQRELLLQEMRLGHEIQTSLLPEKPLRFLDLDIGAKLLAAKEVSGDFYDFFELSDQRLFIVICDTAGKGISACLFSLGLRSILRTLALQEESLEEIVKKANDLYSKDAHKSSMFSTVWLGIYCPKSKKLSYVSRGHPPAFFLRKGRLEEFFSGGIALGTQSFDVAEVKECKIHKGDKIFLYTDGIIEAHNAYRELFGKKRLKETLLESKELSAQGAIDHLIEKALLFSSGEPLHDDITLLMIQRF